MPHGHYHPVSRARLVTQVFTNTERLALAGFLAGYGGLTRQAYELDQVQRSGGDPMHLGPDRLRVIIGQALAAGTFVVCHDTLTYGDYPDYGPAICRGFFEAYSSRSPALILLRAYQRLVEVPPPEAASPGTAAGN